MAIILNLETATRNCSVAIGKGGSIFVVKEISGEGYLHAEKLHLFIQEALTEAGLNFKDLDAVAVSMGPGSYTGLRIGVSAAKGLCYALNLPLIAVDTLEILARKVSVEEGERIIPLIDARRMEAYTAVFDSNYNKLRDTEAEIITAETFNKIGGTIHLLGDGALKCRDLLISERFVYHEEVLFPSAAEMCAVSEYKNKIGDTVDVAYFEPYYLKDFIAGKKL